jgi:hypothetical protein
MDAKEVEQTVEKAVVNRKKYVVYAILAALALGGSFFAGYSRRKVQTKIVEKQVTVTQIQIVHDVHEVEKKVYVARKAKDVTITKHEEKRPDGTVVTDTTIADKTKSQTDSASQSTKDETKRLDETQVQVVEKTIEKKVEILPDFFLGIGAGHQT